jgi:hypothetical protein
LELAGFMFPFSGSNARPALHAPGASPHYLVLALTLTVLSALANSIPATPVMTLYRFNGPLELPYYEAAGFRGAIAAARAGTLVQGTTLVPCLVLVAGRPLTDASGTPFVGFEIVVDPRNATPAATARVTEAVAGRKALTVANHHCAPGLRHVIDARDLYAMEKVPFFDPPPRVGARGAPSAAAPGAAAPGGPDAVVRAFHNSEACAGVNRRLTGRRAALLSAWDAFARDNAGGPRNWSAQSLGRARDLDIVVRTALFEGHLGRACNAYGACERNIVALSIRNRAVQRCLAREGCRARGDFTGVASKVSQYNIWDEYLTQISGLTACYLRDDLAADPYYARLQAMYAQNAGDVQRILFGGQADLVDLFPGAPLADIVSTAHYYHAPAMGKCFPTQPGVEYMGGAVAQNGANFALIANTRLRLDDKTADGYRFRSFRFAETDLRDEIEIRDDYPGFVVDGRKVTGRGPPADCRPYGIPGGCAYGEVGRHRRTPSWLTAGKPVGLTCRVADRTATCLAPERLVTVEVGGRCDTQMRPVSGVH